MAEIGGSSIDDATVNLDSTGDLPGTSNGPQKEGTLKRTADANISTATSAVKKKKTAVERASSSKGRNQAIKQELKDMKTKEREKQIFDENMAKLLDTKEKILEKLDVLEQREMLDDDAAEQRALEREEKLKDCLIQCEKSLKKGNFNFNDEDEAVMKSIHIKIENYPSLDQYVQDFAFEKFSARNPDHLMEKHELVDIIRKANSRDPTIKFPKERTEGFDRLHNSINQIIVDASILHRYELLDRNLKDYPGIDLDALPKEMKEVKTEDGDRRRALHKLIRNISPDSVSDGGIDVINLDDEEDNALEGDEDEMEERNDDDGTSKLDDEDDLLLNLVKECTESDADGTTMELPDEQSKNVKVKLNESKDTKTEEQKSGSEWKGVMGEKDIRPDVRPDSREGKDTVEGGTCTNSPSLERDERMSLEKNDDVHQEAVPMEVATTGAMKGNQIMFEASEEENPTPWNVVANTIVLDDDEDGMEVQEMEVIPPTRRSDLVDGYLEGGSAIGPPVAPKLNPSDAWEEKLKLIQAWVDKLTAAAPDGNTEQDPPSLKRDDEDDDDGIVCLQDDFEFDSVSHSGLEFRKKLKAEADSDDVKPAVRIKAEKKEPSDEVEVIELD